MILLIDFGIIGNLSEPIAIESLHAFLASNNVGCEMYYPIFDKEPLEVVLKEKTPNIVGFSITFNHNINKLISAAKTIKEFDNKIKIIVGGHHPTIYPEVYLLDNIDAVFVGYAEYALLEYITYVNNDISEPTINGVIYHKNQIITACNFNRSMDKLPFMTRKYLPYITNINKVPRAQILSSRGCIGNCSFCSVRNFMRQAKVYYCERTAKNIVNEMEILYNKYNIKHFVFEDDNFFTYENKEEKATKFHELLVEKGLQNLNITMQIRPDMITDELIKLIKIIGVRTLSMGIESFNDEDLKIYNKCIESEALHSSIDVLFNNGYSFDLDAEYRINSGYINFNSFSNKKLLLNSSKWMKYYGLTPKKLLRVLMPYKGTPIYNELINKGLIENEKIKFVDLSIEDIFIQANKVINRLIYSRDIYRLPGKLYRELGVMICNEDLFNRAEKAVRFYDDLMFEAFNNIVISEGRDEKLNFLYDDIANEKNDSFSGFKNLVHLSRKYKKED